jgi:hypothetical protein
MCFKTRKDVVHKNTDTDHFKQSVYYVYHIFSKLKFDILLPTSYFEVFL